MLANHFKIARRNLLKHKLYSTLNIAGLAVGLAVVMFIGLWVRDELRFDKFHEKDAQLYQVMARSQQQTGIAVGESTPGMLASSLAKEMPEVELATTLMPAHELPKSTLLTPAKSVKAGIQVADRDFFTLFSFPLVAGRPGQVLADQGSIVLSETLASNLFGGVAQAVGKNVEWEFFGNKFPLRVSGVFRDVPANSSLQFDFVIPFQLYLNKLWPGGKEWTNEGTHTIVALRRGTDVERFNAKVAGYVKQKNAASIYTLFVRPYSSAYLHGNYENGQPSGGRIEYVNLFTLIAGFILVIASINFMNLTTAKASRRWKEVGIKKAVGATRTGLIFQFLTEAVFIAFLSGVLAVGLVLLLLPQFNLVTGKHLTLPTHGGFLAALAGLTLFTGVLAGSYPALYLSGSNPVAALKGQLRNSVGELWVRKGLVVFQFSVSMLLIVAVIVVYRQVDYVQSKHIGYDKDNLIVFPKEGRVISNSAAFLAEARRIPGVVSASAIQATLMGPSSASTGGVEWAGKKPEDNVQFQLRHVDYGLLETFGIGLAEGRSFSAAYGAENTRLIINRAAARAMGMTHPVGQTVRFWGNEMTIVGVTKDFHFESLHETIKPMVFLCDPARTYQVAIKLAAGQERATLSRLGAFYRAFNPGFPFSFSFVDQTYQAQHVAEGRVSVLSGWFAGLAILISCLGLFGLVVFNAEQRTKEIGIRKVLGASVTGIVALLSRDFLRLVLLAVVLITPLAWYAMHRWLQGFAYRVDLDWWVFALAGGLALGIALLTVTLQSAKAARMNPVRSLRSE